VVTLATYAQSQTQAAIGGQPSDLVVLPGGSSVVAWHNNSPPNTIYIRRSTVHRPRRE
jgi:hypothetical protein